MSRLATPLRAAARAALRPRPVAVAAPRLMAFKSTAAAPPKMDVMTGENVQTPDIDVS